MPVQYDVRATQLMKLVTETNVHFTSVQGDSVRTKLKAKLLTTDSQRNPHFSFKI